MQIEVEHRAIDTRLTPSERLLAYVQALAPDIRARVAEIESGRRIPPDLIETLRSIGIFRMFAPRSHGGLELDLPSALQVVAALGKIDGSVGWTVMIGSGSAIFATLLSRPLYDEIYRNGPDVIFGGSAQPAGKAEMIAGEWRVTGRWPFASGCQHADWLLGFCVMTEDGKPLPGAAEGVPLVKGCVLPARDWQIEDTWYVAGLRGTGSHHITLNDVAVPDEQFFNFIGGAPCIPGPLYAAVQPVLPLLHAAVALGIAEGAIEDLVALVNTGRQQQRTTVPMRESEILQYELGRIEADLHAANSTFEIQVANYWRHAQTGKPMDEALLTRGAQTAIWIAKTCTRLATECFALGGGAAVYDNSPLQRRMRDLLVASQHAAVHPRQYVSSGVRLLGNPQPTA